MGVTQREKGERFRRLHAGACFVIPNPWDVGSAKVLTGMGFAALATSSAAAAASIGKRDGALTREEALAQISSDALEIHRSICALIWAAEARGEIIEFPSADVPPEAVIGVRCVQASRSALSGTSLGHAIDIIGDIVGGRR